MPPEVWPVAESVAVDGANPMAPVVVVVDVVVVLVTAFVGVELLACGEVAAVWAQSERCSLTAPVLSLSKRWRSRPLMHRPLLWGPSKLSARS